MEQPQTGHDDDAAAGADTSSGITSEEIYSALQYYGTRRLKNRNSFSDFFMDSTSFTPKVWHRRSSDIVTIIIVLFFLLLFNLEDVVFCHFDSMLFKKFTFPRPIILEGIAISLAAARADGSLGAMARERERAGRQLTSSDTNQKRLEEKPKELPTYRPGK